MAQITSRMLCILILATCASYCTCKPTHKIVSRQADYDQMDDSDYADGRYAIADDDEVSMKKRNADAVEAQPDAIKETSSPDQSEMKAPAIPAASPDSSDKIKRSSGRENRFAEEDEYSYGPQQRANIEPRTFDDDSEFEGK